MTTLKGRRSANDVKYSYPFGLDYRYAVERDVPYSVGAMNIFLAIKVSEDEMTDAKPNKNKSAVVDSHVPGRIRFKLHSHYRDKETMEGIKRNLERA